MGLFNWFKRQPPHLIHDDLFGELRWLEWEKTGNSYYEGRIFFAPAGKETDIIIPAGKEGPDPSQKEFYKNLCQHFPDYTAKIIPLLEDEFQNWKPEFRIIDFNREFFLVHLEIPRMNTSLMQWQMAFESIHDRNHHFTIEFSGHEPVSVNIDG